MAHELDELRQQLTRLGFADTLATLETELQSHDPSPTLTSVAGDKPSLMPPSVNDKTDSPFPVFAIKTTPRGTDSPVFGRRSSEEDPGTALSFSGQSLTSNASTGGFVASLGLAPVDSPFALQSRVEEDRSPPFGNYDWLTPEGSPTGPALTEFTPDSNTQSLNRVNSFNQVKSKSETIFDLHSEAFGFEEVAVGGKKGVEWEDSERGKEGLVENTENSQDLLQEIFSFPPTPAGSETGSGTALRQLSSLSSRTLCKLKCYINVISKIFCFLILADLVSSESTEKICPKMKSTNIACGQDPMPSSPFSSTSEYAIWTLFVTPLLCA